MWINDAYYNKWFNKVLDFKKKQQNKRYIWVDQFRSTCILGAYYFKNENQGKEL